MLAQLCMQSSHANVASVHAIHIWLGWGEHASEADPRTSNQGLSTLSSIPGCMRLPQDADLSDKVAQLQKAQQQVSQLQVKLKAAEQEVGKSERVSGLEERGLQPGIVISRGLTDWLTRFRNTHPKCVHTISALFRLSASSLTCEIN